MLSGLVTKEAFANRWDGDGHDGANYADDYRVENDRLLMSLSLLKSISLGSEEEE
jgi:hypothetical protein